MFQFQPRQTKWALTACLLGALGFSASLPTKEAANYALRLEQGLNDEMIMMAATDPDMKQVTIKNMNGEEHVVYIKKVDSNKTQVLSTKKFEGQSCEAGGMCLSSRVLDIPFESSAEQIAGALLFKIAAEKSVPDKPNDKDEPSNEVKTKRERDKEMLRRIAVTCERREGDNKGKCIAEAFIDLLKSRRSGDMINSDDAFDFYQEEIEQALREMLLSQEVGSTDYAKASNLLRKLQSGLPKNYNRIRDSAMKMVTDSVKKHATTMMQNANTAAEYANQIKKVETDMNALLQQRQAAINGQRWQEAELLALRYNSLQQRLPQLSNQYTNYSMKARSYRDWINTSYAPMLNSDIRSGLDSALSRSLITQDVYNNMYNPFESAIQNLQAGIYDKYSSITVNPATVNVAAPTQAPPPIPGRGDINSGRGVITFGPPTRQVNPNVK